MPPFTSVRIRHSAFAANLCAMRVRRWDDAPCRAIAIKLILSFGIFGWCRAGRVYAKINTFNACLRVIVPFVFWCANKSQVECPFHPQRHAFCIHRRTLKLYTMRRRVHLYLPLHDGKEVEKKKKIIRTISTSRIIWHYIWVFRRRRCRQHKPHRRRRHRVEIGWALFGWICGP